MSQVSQKVSDSSLKNYIDSLRPENSTFLDYCWEVWQHFNGYFLLQKAQVLEVPDACIGDGKGFMFTWEKDEHYLECEIFEDQSIEFFYKNKASNELAYSDASTLEDGFPDTLLHKMSFFVHKKEA